VLKGLKSITTEDQILDHMKVFGPVEQVRLMKDKTTGESRGFAFVDFPSIEDAQRVLSYTNRILVIDGCNIHLDYSKGPQQKPAAPAADHKDWLCTQVSASTVNLSQFSATLPILLEESNVMSANPSDLILHRLRLQLLKSLLLQLLFED
jgi:RNA recognition motif-containing protein